MKFRSILTSLIMIAVTCSSSNAFAAVPPKTTKPAVNRAVSRTTAKPVSKPAAKPATRPAPKPAAEAFNPKPEIIHGLPWYKPVEGFKLAEKLHKPIMVDVFTDWCGWCKVMDRVTFPDPAVSKILTQNYVLVKANAEDGGAGTEIATRVGIKSLPTCLFFNWQRNVVAGVTGFRKPEIFTMMLQEALALNKRFKSGTQPIMIDVREVPAATAAPASAEEQPAPANPSTTTP